MIFGASLGWFLSHFSLDKFKVKLYDPYDITLGILSLIFFVSLIIGQSRGAYGVGIILGLLIIYFVAKSKKIKLFFIFTTLPHKKKLQNCPSRSTHTYVCIELIRIKIF